MGYFFGRGIPVPPVVTGREYLGRVWVAYDILEREPERRGPAYQRALHELAEGRPTPAIEMFLALLERRPEDPGLHRILGISHLRAGNVRLAVRHLETAVMLLDRAATPARSLLSTLRIEIEALVVRLALVEAYRRLGHRAAIARCLLHDTPLDRELHFRPPR